MADAPDRVGDIATRSTAPFLRKGSCFRPYYQTVEYCTEAPTHYHLVTMLSLLGATVGRNVVLPHGAWEVYPLTASLLIGPSGVGKGEAMAVGQRVLRELRPGLSWVGDEATPRGIVMALMRDRDGTLREDGQANEVAIWAGEMATLVRKELHLGGLLPVVTKLLEQPPEYTWSLAQDLQRGEVAVVRRPATTLVAGSTIEWMRSAMPSQLFEGGFFRRCLMVVGSAKERILPDPRHLTSDRVAAIAAAFREALGDFIAPPQPLRADMTKSRALWDSYYRNHHRKAPDEARLIGHHNAWPQHLKRTALCFALSCGRLEILPEDFRLAADFLEELQPHTQQVLMDSFDPTSSLEQLDALERWFRQKRRTRALKQEVHRDLRLSWRDFENLLETASRMGMIDVHGAALVYRKNWRSRDLSGEAAPRRQDFGRTH